MDNIFVWARERFEENGYVEIEKRRYRRAPVGTILVMPGEEIYPLGRNSVNVTTDTFSQRLPLLSRLGQANHRAGDHASAEVAGGRMETSNVSYTRR